MPVVYRIPALSILLSLHYLLVAGQQKHLYIANDDHTDYFWTADDATYREAFIRQLDYYIGLMETQNDTLPPAFQHRYNCDNTLWVYEYEKAKTVGEFQRLIDQIKSGHISVPFNPLVPVYGGQNAEIALRGMYYGGYLERRYGIDIDLAVMMENQTLPLGISSLWAGAGAKYSWKGVCSCASPDLDFQNRKHEMYYSHGRDGKGVLMKWYDLITNQHLGGYAECRFPNQAITDMDEKCNTPKYPFAVAGAFGYGWDDLENYIDYFPLRARLKSDATRQVFVSNEVDFFQDFESRYGASIPTQTVSFGNDWDLLIATMAEVSGDIKRSAEKLRAAEAMAALVVLKDTSFARDLDAIKELAWISVGKYYDHDWTADGPVSSERAQFQRDMERHFSSYVDTLYVLSRNALSEMILNPGSDNRFFVFNPLGWSRTDVADIPYSGPLPVTVFDITTQQEVPTQYIERQGRPYVRILASDVPSVGYKIFRFQESLPSDLSPAATYNDGVFENSRYILEVNKNGTIASFIDKQNGQYEYNGGVALNDFGDSDPFSGTDVIRNPFGPVSAAVTFQSTSPFPHTTLITLYRDIARVEIENIITENPGNSTITFTYPLNIENPVIWHEEVGAVLQASLEDNGGHYASQNARYDWQTANHFVYAGNENHGMNISNLGSHFFKLGNSSIETLDQGSSDISFLAAGKVGYGTLGINNQGGDTAFHFQYALQPAGGAFDQASSMKMAMEHQNPFVTGDLRDGVLYPEKSFSLLSITEPDVFLWSLKPSEEGGFHGLIARVWNQGEASSLTVDGTLPLLSAMHTSLVETDLSPADVLGGDLITSIGEQEMKTYRLFFGDTLLNHNQEIAMSRADLFDIYPNPFDNLIHIKSLNPVYGNYTVTLFNALGQVINKKEITLPSINSIAQLSTHGLPPGIFYIKVQGDQHYQVSCLLKKE